MREYAGALLTLLAGAAILPACDFPGYSFTPAGGAAGAAGALQSVAGAAGALQQAGELAGSYRLVAVFSSKCIDADGPLSADGNITIIQHACDSSRPQTFTATASLADNYTFVIDGTSDCLAIENDRLEDRASVARAPCDGRPGERWLPVPQSDGSYFLVNYLSKKCLEVPGFDSDDAKNLHQFVCNVGANQRWALASLIPTPVPLVVDERYAAQASTGDGVAGASVNDCSETQRSDAIGRCHSLELNAFPSGATLTGVRWLYPNGNDDGAVPGLLISRAASRIRFRARGSRGGEKAWFSAGGVGGTFPDGFDVSPGEVQLSSNWQSFSLELQPGSFDSGIIKPLEVSLKLEHNAAPLRVEVDDIVVE